MLWAKKKARLRCTLPSNCFLIAGCFIQKVASSGEAPNAYSEPTALEEIRAFLTNRNIQSSGPVGHPISKWFRLSRKDCSTITSHLITSFIFWEAVTSGAVVPQLTLKCWPCPEGRDKTFWPPSPLGLPALLSPGVMMLLSPPGDI